MLLTHETTIVLNKNDANIVGHMCYAAYKLWNVCNYERNNYKNLGLEKYPDWYYQKSKHKDDLWFKSLPSQTAQEICKLLDKSWKSFYRLKESGGIENPGTPRYKKVKAGTDMGKMTLQQILMQLAGGMGTSIQIFAVTLVFSLPLGLFVALGRMSRNKILQAVIKVYISVMRGTPLMLQLLVVYFGPYYMFGMRVSNSYRLWAVFIGFVINYAAYFAEIYRSGIQSMPVGQYEAAKLLGYSKSHTFITIILPQVIKRILPSVTNEVITLVKDTSLAFTLSVMEMFTTAKALASSQVSMMPFVAAGIFYYVFNLIVAMFLEWLEKKLDYYR